MNEVLTEIAKKAMIEHCISHVRLQEFADLLVDAVYNHILDATMHDNPFPYREDVKQYFGVNNE